MATLEDKILGNKLHNYCSSSEDDGNSEDSDSESPKKSMIEQETQPTPQEINPWEGTSTNTGPKGVLKDWQRFKQLENEKKVEDEQEKIALMKKLTLTTRSSLDEEKDLAEDPELAELLTDEFLLNYQKQRMQEMLEQTNHKKKFGELICLSTGQEFLDAIDKEHKSVKVVVHIYENNVQACRVMNNCLKKLCKIYTDVKFCTIVSSQAGMTTKFKLDGVPALLVYKGGNLIGNFVKLSDELGSEFLTEDVQDFLIEHGMLADKSCVPSIVKSAESDDSE